MLNPYLPPNSKTEGEEKPRKASRVAWLIVPTLLLMLYGSLLLPEFVGQSVGDPYGRSRGAGVGGAIGLALGTVGFVLSGREPKDD